MIRDRVLQFLYKTIEPILETPQISKEVLDLDIKASHLLLPLNLTSLLTKTKNKNQENPTFLSNRVNQPSLETTINPLDLPGYLNA